MDATQYQTNYLSNNAEMACLFSIQIPLIETDECEQKQIQQDLTREKTTNMINRHAENNNITFQCTSIVS